MNLFIITKKYNAGKKTHEANKDIDLMSTNELREEVKYIYDKYKNADSLNDRAKDIFRECFTYGKHIDFSIYTLLDTCFRFNSDKIREQLFDLYFDVKDYPQEYLKNFMYTQIWSFEPTDEVKLERKTNEIKRKINNFTEKITRPFRKTKAQSEETNRHFVSERGLQKYKKNPFELSISYEKEKAFAENNKQQIEFIKTLILKNCYEAVDLEHLLQYSGYDYSTKLYEILPEDKKADFATMFVTSNFFKHLYYEQRIQILDKFNSNLSRETLVELYLKYSSKDENFMPDFKITNKELVDYYIKSKGHIYYLDSDEEEILQAALKEVPFENIRRYLEGINEPEQYYLYELYSCIPKEDIKKILENDKIHQKIKDDILVKMLHKFSNSEKLDMFDSFSSEKQKKFLREFSYVFTKDIEQYSNALFDIIKDKNLQRLYGILHCNHKISATEFVELINEVDYIFHDRELLLKFSDDEIKMIYDNLKKEDIKDDILELSRQKSTLWLRDDEIQEIEKYNETVPNNILINENTILYYLQTANSLKCYQELLMREEIHNLEFSQLLECYKMFLEKKDVLQKENIFEFVKDSFKCELVGKMNFKDYIKLSNEKIMNKTEFLELAKNFYFQFDTNNLLYEIPCIENVEDPRIKQVLLEKLNTQFTYNEENNTNKINSLYKERILDKNISVDNKYLYLGMLLHNYINHMRGLDDKDYHKKLIAEIQTMFEKINDEANKSQYNNIFDLTPKYKRSDFLDKDIFTLNYFNIANCLPYLNNDKVYTLMQKLYKNNSNIQNVISAKFLNDKLIDIVDYELIEYLSRYGINLEYNEDMTQELSDAETEVFIKAYNRLKIIKTYPEEDSIKIISTIKRLGDKDISETDFDNENNLDLLLAISLNDNISSDFSEVQPNENSTKLETFKEKIKDDARKEAHSVFLNKRKILNAIGKRFFYSSYIEMQSLKRKYGSDFKEIYELYTEKAKQGLLSIEEENELKSLTIYRNISELMKIKDTKALVRVFDELDELEEYENCDFAAMSVLEENLKRVYSKDLQKKAYMLDEKDKKGQIDGIDIYSPTNFKMFVHVVAAFGKYNLIDKNNLESSAKDIWNSAENKVNHILCTSYIGNDNMCYARKNNKESKSLEDEQVIFGFSNISNSEIIMASKSDIGSHTSDFTSSKSNVLSDFRLSDKMIRECRYGHNEVDLERRLKDNKLNNIQPEYIVCFNEINNNSKKVAKDFNIPIVLIDKKEVAKEQNEKLNNLIKKFKEEKQPELLEEIINLYQCSRHSFLTAEDKALAEEFFLPEEMNHTVENLINTIEQEQTIGNKEKANNCYLALYSALDKEVKLCKEEGVDVEYFGDSRFHLRKFRHDLKQIIKKNHINKTSEQINYGTAQKQYTINQTLSNERISEEHGRE